MKRFLIILSILFTVLLTIFACKKVNLLAPTYIPEETKFRVPANNQTIPSKIDVNPQPAKNGEVFGGFIRKFQYKGEWYVLATNKYYYDATNKILTESGKQFLLKFDKNGNLSVLNSGKPIKNNIWNHLTNFNIIETNQVWYIPKYSRYGRYSHDHIRFDPPPTDNYIGRYIKSMYLNNLTYNSDDLLNWGTKGSIKTLVMNFPQDYSWQNTGVYLGADVYGMDYVNVYFKGKLYVLGGGKGLYYQTLDKDGDNRNFSQFRVIDWANKDKASDVSSWSSYNYPWEDGGTESAIDVYVSADKLYIERIGNYIWTNTPSSSRFKALPRKVGYYDSYGQKLAYKRVIYSTTGNPNQWQKENSIPNGNDISNADYYLSGGSNSGPQYYHPTTPEPPDWVFDKDNNRYYKTATNYSGILFNGKHYSLPIPPVNEIKKAADSGKTNFVITEEHIENSGKNQFMVSLVNPDNAKESDWKLITPLEYTGYSMIWQIGGGNTLFNIHGKTIQLLDYCEMQNFLNYNNSAYNPIINELRRKAKTERSKSQYYNAMYYEAQADILEAILKNGGYIEPSESITHYEIEFRYR